MTDADKESLASLERLIVVDRISVKTALEAAFNLGDLNGQLKVARITEESLGELLKVVEP